MEPFVYVGLGSNLGDPLQQVQQAIHSLRTAPAITDLFISPFYQSKAIGPGEQPDYINAVVRFRTGLQPSPLLKMLQAIETAQQRVRVERWGPRTIDLDILLYGEQVLNSPSLTVPHPRMMERSFVLVPLSDLSPDLTFPSGTSLSETLHQVDCSDLLQITLCSD